MVNSTITAATQSTVSTATTATSTSSTSSSSAGSSASNSAAISADVAAQVKQALAPAAAGAQKITAALTQGQARLSSLGQLKSAIADFQTITQSLSAAATTKADGSAADPTAKLQSFVSAFNTLNTKLQTLQKGDLKSDPGLAQVTAQLAQMLRDTGSGSGAASLAKASITLDSSGAG
jgi:flagellar hook-associated protein 2